MVGWLKNRLTRAKRARSNSSPRPQPVPEGLVPRTLAAAEHFRTLQQAKQLCAALDRGAELQLWDHVERLAESASKLPWLDAPLADRLARIKVAQGEPATALAMLDRGVSTPASSRLLRIMCLLHTGARMQAQLELREWMRSEHGSPAPREARLLLALLDWQAGDIESASDLMRDVAHGTEDDVMRWAQMALVLLAAARGQWDRATAQARKLAGDDACISEREIALMLDSLRLANPVDPEQQRSERIEQMARELPAAFHLIEPLVEAQRRQLDEPVAEELLEALEKSLDLAGPHHAAAAEGAARLAAMLGDTAKAIVWAQRGLAVNPMSARLALLINELTESGDARPAAHRAGGAA